MFEQHNAEFFNDYFKEHSDYVLTKDFIQIRTNKNEKYYIGYVQHQHTIHPLELRVEIPVNFPHQKLTLWTYRLKGYPHLIEQDYKRPAFSQHPSKEETDEQEFPWSWFCLNAPFAETAKEQLDEELKQLQIWIDRMLRPELPAIIDDEKFTQAMAIVDPVHWATPNLVHVLRTDAKVTFVGEHWEKLSAFREDYTRRKDIGMLHCVKNSSNKIYVFDKNTDCNCELPYVLVSEAPQQIGDFLALQKQYGWSNDVAKQLLHFDSFGMPTVEYKSQAWEDLNERCEYCETHADAVIHELDELKIHGCPPRHQEVVNPEIDTILNRYNTKGVWIEWAPSAFPEPKREEFESDTDYQEAINEYYESEAQIAVADQAEIEASYRKNSFRTFMLGIVNELADSIRWYVFSSREVESRWKETEYDLRIKTIIVKDLIKLPLFVEFPNHIHYSDYFGRGAAPADLTEKKVAIVGLGAIGSQVAETLARSGVKHFGLWDNDILEPCNLCRASYERRDIGEIKANAAARRILAISPYATIHTHYGVDKIENGIHYINTRVGYDLYGTVNYQSQEKVLKELEPYDIIIDCTASNELLHFLSYAVTDKLLLSLCITNRSKNLLCLSSADGNCFELRKIYLSKIEQDTKNYYHEGSGCFSPTFLASYSDIAALVNVALYGINEQLLRDDTPRSVIWSYTERGVLADRLKRYSCDLQNGNIVHLTVPSEALLDAEEIEYPATGPIGFIFGAYSRDCLQLMVSHFVPANIAEQKLEEIFELSHGVIDYLGDFEYSCKEGTNKYEQVFRDLQARAWSPDVNVNNPILAMRQPDGSIDFMLYFNGQLLPFVAE